MQTAPVLPAPQRVQSSVSLCQLHPARTGADIQGAIAGIDQMVDAKRLFEDWWSIRSRMYRILHRSDFIPETEYRGQGDNRG